MPRKSSSKVPAKSSSQTSEKSSGQMERSNGPGHSIDPLSRLGISDWFDRWPDLFARRWPESFQGIPFIDEGFRLEQYTDDDGTIVVRGELPGIDPESDLDIEVADDRLTICAKREQRSEREDNGSYRSEFRYGSFQRSVRLPAGYRADDVRADYDDGILEVRVPVEENAQQVTKVPVGKKH